MAVITRVITASIIEFLYILFDQCSWFNCSMRRERRA